MVRVKKIISIVLTVFLIASLCSACGSGYSVSENSPVILNAVISSRCDGGESDQYVDVALEFDRDIQICSDKTDSLRVTVAGNRNRNISISQGENSKSAVITIPVNAVTNGIIHIGKSESSKVIDCIRGTDGSCASDFEIEGSTPSGVTLSTVSAEPGKTVKNVETYWNIRSIAWIGIYEDGSLVKPGETDTDETLDGYIAVHGHEFLTEDQDIIAEKIVDVLQKNYDSSFTFTCSGSEITVEKSGSDSIPDICIYEYISINGVRTDLTRVLTSADK